MCTINDTDMEICENMNYIPLNNLKPLTNHVIYYVLVNILKDTSLEATKSDKIIFSKFSKTKQMCNKNVINIKLLKALFLRKIWSNWAEENDKNAIDFKNIGS